MAKPKASRDLLDKVIAKVMAGRPRKQGVASFELARSTKAVASRVKYVLKTGIPSIDATIGGHMGGMPFGRIIEPFGLESSGKTALAKLCVVQAQKKEIYERIFDEQDRTISLKKVDPDEIDVVMVYLDQEQSIDRDGKMEFYDPIQRKNIEIDCGLGDADTVDQMFKIMDNTLEVVKENKAETKREQFVIFVVDTIAATSSKEEVGAQWGTDDYPRQPKQLKQGFRKLVHDISRNNLLMICTNQVGDSFAKSHGPKLSVPQSKDFSSPGGKALKFYASLRLFMYQLGEFKLSKKSKFADGLRIGFFTVKNRQVKPLREGRAVLLFDDKLGGFNPELSLLEDLIYLKFAEIDKLDGSIRFRFNHWKIDKTTFSTTAEGVGAVLEEDDRGGSSGDPSIASRAEWFKFLADHQADFDRMWLRAVEYLFATEGLSNVEAPSEDEDDDDDVEFPEDQ